MNAKHVLNRLRSGGFTMIELLIVIAILGILAVAVLAALNPIEQINRGRDTSSKSDAEQLIAAIDRFTAYVGWYPWMTKMSADVADRAMAWTEINAIDAVEDADGCSILDKLSQGNTDGSCPGSDDLKSTFIQRIAEENYNHLFIYNRGAELGDSNYVCFTPRSQAFIREAATRCGDDANTSNLPADLIDAYDEVCGGDQPMVCLP